MAPDVAGEVSERVSHTQNTDIVNEDLYVCAECFGDSGIRRFIQDNATSNDCSFCGNHSKDPIAAPIDEVADYINQCLYEEYDMAENWLGRMDQEWVRILPHREHRF